MMVFIVWFCTTALYAVPVFIGARRLVLHLKDNQEACEAFTRHVLVPLLGRKAEQPKDAVEPTADHENRANGHAEWSREDAGERKRI